MNPMKSEVKLAVLKDLSERFGEFVVQSEREQMVCVGAKNALVHARKEISHLLSELDKDMDDGTLKVEQLQAVKRRVMRTDGGLENLALKNEMDSVRMIGRAEAFRMSVKFLQKQFDEERSRLQAVLNSLESEGVEPTAEAASEQQRPISLAQQRKAEEASAEPSNEQTSAAPTETPPEIPATEALPEMTAPSEVPRSKPPTKRRGDRAQDA